MARLLFITPSLRKGGAETQLIKLARFLRSRGFEVTIIALKPFNTFDTDFDQEGIQVFFFKNWKSSLFSNCLSLYKLVRDYKPEVVIAFMFIAIIFARLLKIFFGFKLISSIRTPVIAKKYSLLFRVTGFLDDLVVYNSFKSKFNFEQKKLIQKKGVVVNNAIALPPANHTILKTDGSTFVWICIAHFVPEKDYRTLFEAVRLLKNKNFRLDILGNLYGQEWPFEMIRQLDIEERVRIHGFKTETLPFLMSADAFVLSSFLEGMPNALLEAMACGKPVVASSVDGIEELLKPVHCGYLFQQGNAAQLAEQMTKVMEMPAPSRNALGLRGKSHVEDNFSEKMVMEKWLEIISPFIKTPLATASIA